MPNPFYLPELLLPAWDTLCEQDVVVLLACWSGSRLIGIIPLKHSGKAFGHSAVGFWEVWRYRHCYSCAPLILAGEEPRVLSALATFLGAESRLGALLSVPVLPLASTVFDAIATSGSGPFASYETVFERACLLPGRPGYVPFDTRTSKKRLKEYERLRRRLADSGPVRLVVHDTPVEAEARIREFLELEHSTWKGGNGTSLLARPDDREFAARALPGLARQGKLHVYELRAGDRLVSTLLVFASGTEAYMFKMAHDERAERYSPGSLLLIECTRYWERSPYRIVDSCASPGHSLIERLWSERRSIAKVHLACKGVLPRTRIAAGRLKLSLKRLRAKI